MKKYLILILILVGSLISCKRDKAISTHQKEQITFNIADSLNQVFEEDYKKGHLPGFALSIFTMDSIYFIKGYGYSDIESKKPFDENTVQGIASISKTLIAVSLMKAIEDGILNLDDDVNSILPFQVTNPKHKTTPITLKHLATHTSSISDDANYDKAYVFSDKLDEEKFPKAWSKYIRIYNTNQSMTMQEFLSKVFDRTGEWNTKENFLNEKPGEKYEYSNIGAALLAYCIELKSGKDYKQYSTELILDKLEMNSSTWHYKEVNQENHITYYNENYNPVPNYEVSTYPDGGLYSSVNDLTKYLQEMMKGYQGEGSILKPTSYKEMMTNQIPTLDSPTGIIWDMDNTCCIGHGGNDFGIATMAFFDPKTKIGKVLFTNITIEKEEQMDQFYTSFNNMFKYDSEIEKASR